MVVTPRRNSQEKLKRGPAPGTQPTEHCKDNAVAASAAEFEQRQVFAS
jgi:hypothetical protein